MRSILLVLLLIANGLYAQKINKADKKTLAHLKQSVTYLADDKLEGRRTGTAGEKLAYEYISGQFKKAGLLPYGDNGTYLQKFSASTKEDRYGHNVVGFINNNAPSTVILGAHFDHLGYGEDKNSMYHDSVPMIHNGADDNASGTAALIEMAKWLPQSNLKKYNYLFIAFSGEELGLFGSKFYTDHPTVPLANTNYMINMDMVGRLNDSSRSITVGGFGTSPAWGQIIKTDNAVLNIKTDSSGTGPSDHTSFYRQDIPVLFFFTGTHTDYHKPGDDAYKINYKGMLHILQYIKNIIAATNDRDKLVFTKTREVTAARTAFKVSMGIMPDYTFAGPGVYVDGVTSDKPAEKAGVQKGDIVLQLGEFITSDLEGYMKALGSLDKGQTVDAKIRRADKEIILKVVF